jgi:hypothetical protein
MYHLGKKMNDHRSGGHGMNESGGGLSGSYRARAVICGTVKEKKRPECKASNVQSQATSRKKKKYAKSVVGFQTGEEGTIEVRMSLGGNWRAERPKD